MSLRLHAVVRATHRLPEDSPFRLVEVEGLAVVVSEVESGRAPTEQEATTSLAGLCALVPTGPVLPLRIGTAAPDEPSARAAALALTVPVLQGHLDRLDGLAEMHVHLVFDEEVALREVYDEVALTSRNTDMAAIVAQGEQIARKIVAWRRVQADALLAPVTALAREVALIDASGHTEERRAFLVPLEQVEDVRAAVSAVESVTATCVGPLPAFHFLGPATPLARQDSRPTSRWGW
ncbi:GvpL/GvpF family gas vesicle protein [Streptomyces sp. ID05-26A]|nr:GvpL/GvpF family gas vesicle protein [Streptomyces sp. ID05-26A]